MPTGPFVVSRTYVALWLGFQTAADDVLSLITRQAARVPALEPRRAARQRRVEHPSARNHRGSRAQRSDRAVVGFDRACYRLGYGGGFFDLTLATMKNSPLKLGVGYRQQALPTIHPQPNDIPMDMVITEEGAARC